MRILSIFSWLKTHPKRSIVGAIVLVLLGFGIASAMRPAAPEYVTAVAARGDLTRTVEAVGTVISDRDLQLQFPVSGVTADVYVKEGDSVKAGQRLAVLRSGNQSAYAASLAARVAQAEAELRARTEGNRPEDILIAEAELDSKRAALETARTTLNTAEQSVRASEQKIAALKEEAAISLAGTTTNVSGTVSKNLTTGITALRSIDDIWSRTDVQDILIKYDQAQAALIQSLSDSAESDINAVLRNNASTTDFAKAMTALEGARTSLSFSADILSRAYNFISALPENAYYTAASREADKSTLANEKANVQTAVTSIDTEIKALRDATASYATQIAAEEGSLISSKGARDKALSDIATYESSVRIAEAQLQLKRAGSRQSDIDAAAAALRQARADLARAGADLRDRMLTAPIDGTITQVHVKVGEYTPTGAAITMLGTAPYRVEMFVSEIDIPKVHTTQTGSIELDAFPGVDYKLRVTEIDPASTDVDGVAKYRVKLDFVYPHDEFKIGMSGDAEIVTGQRSDVVSVPRRAVLEDEDGKEYVRVLEADGTVTEKTVVTGMEGTGGDMEVTGIEEGDTIIVLEKE